MITLTLRDAATPANRLLLSVSLVTHWPEMLTSPVSQNRDAQLIGRLMIGECRSSYHVDTRSLLT